MNGQWQQSETKQIRVFFSCFLLFLLLLPLGYGLIPVDDRSRFTMRTQNVLIVMKYKQAHRSRSHAQSHLFQFNFQLSLEFCFIFYHLSVWDIIHWARYADSHRLFAQKISSSHIFFLFFTSFSFVFFYAYNLLNFFSLQRLNFINSNKTDKIKINGILWRNDEREKEGKNVL